MPSWKEQRRILRDLGCALEEERLDCPKRAYLSIQREMAFCRFSRGEGLIGLTRAFLYAGTPSVLVSLWSVQESSAMVMKNFYRNLKDGMSKAEALRQAKLKLIQTREGGLSFAHPFLWAPFVLMGEGS